MKVPANDGCMEKMIYYYGLNIEPDYIPPYFKLKKGEEIESFDKFNIKTWKNVGK